MGPDGLPPETKLGDIIGEDDGGIGRWRDVDGEQTVGEFLGRLQRGLAGGRSLTIGTPEKVADDIESWLDDVGIDGINLLQYHSYDTARDFIELVVPVLRARAAGCALITTSRRACATASSARATGSPTATTAPATAAGAPPPTGAAFSG